MAQKGCIFYDATILFDLISARMHQTILKRSPDSTRHLNSETLHAEAKALGIPRLVSLQTIDLLEKRVREAGEFLAEVMRSLSKHLLEKKKVQGSDKLTPFQLGEDIFLIEVFLFEQFKGLRSTRDWEMESLRSIERLIVKKVQELGGPKKQEIDTQELVNEFGKILVEFNEISEARKTAFTELKKEIEVVDLAFDPPTGFVVRQRCGVMDEEDVRQLAAAIQYQKTSNSWVVFVSTDYRHIITATPELFHNAKLVCSQPLYAIQHLSRVINSKGDHPYPEKAGYVT